ncbi:MAG: AlpA family phage regulatory protein [Verrucomicrobiota bacterium]
MEIENDAELGYLRLPQVLRLIPVSKSTWFRGIQSGKYPRPVKLGIRASGWKVSDIRRCIAEIDVG